MKIKEVHGQGNPKRVKNTRGNEEGTEKKGGVCQTHLPDSPGAQLVRSSPISFRKKKRMCGLGNWKSKKNRSLAKQASVRVQVGTGKRESMANSFKRDHRKGREIP